MRTTPAGPPAATPDAAGGVRGLLEREAELDGLRSLVARTAGGAGGLMVVEGQAGVGKTELLRSASALGEAAGMRVLRGRGAELDRAFAFGVVRQLLEREVTQSAGSSRWAVPSPPPRSSAPAMAGAPPRTASTARCRACSGWSANLSAQQPLLLVADDLHWADTASLRWLVFLAERLEDVPVLLVAATRPAEPGADQELLDALMTAPTARVLRPAPLSEEATTAFVHGHLPEAVDSFAAACHRATGGNPFLLGELIDELAAGHVRGTAKDATPGPRLRVRARRSRRAAAAAASASRGARGRPGGGGAGSVRHARPGGRPRGRETSPRRRRARTRWSASTCSRPAARSTSCTRSCAAPSTSRSRRCSARRCTPGRPGC